MISTNLAINKERLETNLKILSQFGRNERGGIDRTTFTMAELEARNWLIEQLQVLGLTIKIDEAANIWANRKGQETIAPIVFGSHIDTVPNGGMYDGAIGVLIGMEVMERLNEAQILTRHPLTLVSFTAEEPNPFGLSTLGSRAVTKRLLAKDLIGVINNEGLTIQEALRSAGGNPDRFDEAVLKPNDVSAFLEVHIEQGKRLVNNDIPIGVVTSITGIYREKVIIKGEANHAGTTLMNDRKDALVIASQCILLLENICKNDPSDEVVGTIGKLAVQPNAANIIPEEVVLNVEIRGKTMNEINRVVAEWGGSLAKIEQKMSCKIEREILLDQPPSPMDQHIIKTIESSAHQLSYPTMRLGSMAGHDATHMATITRSGMIFVPSVNGKSHCPEEFSRMEDIEKAANTLLHAILALDQSLNKEVM